jgi:hypothetical protein
MTVSPLPRPLPSPALGTSPKGEVDEGIIARLGREVKKGSEKLGIGFEQFLRFAPYPACQARGNAV